METLVLVTCPRCGKENPEGAKFCLECGNALAAALRPPREERKVLTVLFADLVGFTSQAERMDPEEVRAVLQPYHAAVRADLEHYGGTVEKFIGDAVMALFGARSPMRTTRSEPYARPWPSATRSHPTGGCTSGSASRPARHWSHSRHAPKPVKGWLREMSSTRPPVSRA